MNKMAIVRIVVFVLAWVNSILVAKGMQELPLLSEEEISSVVTFLASVWVMVRNNSVKKTDKPV